MLEEEGKLDYDQLLGQWKIGLKTSWFHSYKKRRLINKLILEII